jgi:hypothetical protein
MAVIAPWLEPPNFLEASKSGAALAQQRRDMLERAAEHAAQIGLEHDRLGVESSIRAGALKQHNDQVNAAIALRQAALKQAGLLGQERIDNRAGEDSAIEGLKKAQQEAIERKTALAKDPNAMSLKDEFAWFDKQDAQRAKEKALADHNAAITAAAASKASSIPAGLQSAIFTQLLKNSTGGTNVNQALEGLNNYKMPPAPAEDSASASLLAPTAAAETGGLPDYGTPAPAVDASKTFTDKTGTTYIYNGNADDPSTDKNPDNWQLHPAQ